MPRIEVDKELLAALHQLEGRSGKDWISSVEDRKQSEAEFHDKSHELTPNSGSLERGGRWSNSKFYRTTSASKGYLDSWMRDHVEGAVVLDYACGNGVFGLRAADAGARFVIGIDISQQSIQNARELAASKGISDTTFFVQGDCEETRLPSESIDVVLCGGVLHHLDLSYALPELRRIMKPGAVLLAAEPLNYNPAIKLYRRLTPHLRTTFEAEHILTHNDLKFISRFLDIQDVRYFHLFSVLTAPLLGTRFFDGALRLANLLDGVILKVKPFCYLAWQVYFELARPEVSKNKNESVEVL